MTTQPDDVDEAKQLLRSILCISDEKYSITRTWSMCFRFGKLIGAYFARCARMPSPWGTSTYISSSKTYVILFYFFFHLLCFHIGVGCIIIPFLFFSVASVRITIRYMVFSLYCISLCIRAKEIVYVLLQFDFIHIFAE